MPASYPDFVMRRAFVLQVGAESEPAAHQFAGWIEEVDTGHELRFHSTTQLLDFLRLCIERSEERATPRPETTPRAPRGAHKGDAL